MTVANRQQKAERDLHIITLANRGFSIPTIARQVGLSVEGVRHIVNEGREMAFQQLSKRSTLEHVRDTLALFEEAIEEYARIAQQRGLSAQTRLAAIRGKIETASARFAMLQSAGLAAQHLGTVRHELDAAQLAADLVEVIRDLDLGEEAVGRVLDVVEGQARELPAA